MAAVPAEKRAKATLDLIAGVSVRAVAKKYGIPHGTIADWSAVLGHSKKGAERASRKTSAYHEKLEEACIKAMGALITLGELLTDREYIRNLPTEELVIRHNLLSDRIGRHLEAERAFASRAAEQSALPQPVIDPELVGESSEVEDVA